jgi:putative DNA modification/repair radical SAM protein
MREILQMDRIMEKLTILSAAARYDVACTSSGVQRGGDGTHTGNAYASGICHAFTGDGRCISLLKILYTNDCIYDCKYCRNRCSNDVKRVSFTPEEICKLTMEFYRRNYIEGLFLSSGILHSPDYTMGLLYETLYLLRTKYHFNGYIHVKGIPGASADLLELTGYLADRMSVNLELPTADALRQIAPNKVRKNILSPMRQLQNGIRQSREFHGVSSMKSRMYLDEKTYYNQMAEMKESYARLQDYHDGIAAIREHKARQSAVQSWGEEIAGGENSSRVRNVQKKLPQTTRGLMRPDHYFVPAGQSTQMVIGASDESDYQIISVSEALYQKFEMKRIFYSAFINVNHDSSLPDLPGPPLLREHRLYQADFLLRFYGFRADELLSEKNPNFNEQIDPKCNWAVHHLELFPVEINRADYYTLLRVPGIGTKSARRIMAARRYANLDFSDLKKIGVVLKRAVYFITCKGKMMYHTRMEEGYITRNLMYQERPMQMLLSDGTVQTYEQLSLFDDRGKIVV